jgi:hypothetical protein
VKFASRALLRRNWRAIDDTWGRCQKLFEADHLGPRLVPTAVRRIAEVNRVRVDPEPVRVDDSRHLIDWATKTEHDIVTVFHVEWRAL